MIGSPAATRFSLLSFACLLTIAAFAVVNFLRYEVELRGTEANLVTPLVVAFAFLVSAAVINADGRPRDPFLLPLVALLSGLGLALLHHVKPEFVARQTTTLVLGIAAMTVIARAREARRIARYKYLCAAAAALLLLLVIALGKPLGARGDIKLSIPLGPLGQFQPADFVRILLVVFLAGFLAEKREALTFASSVWWRMSRNDGRYLGPMLLAWGVAMALLVTQRDLGAALLMFGLFVGMLYLGSARVVYVLIGGALFGAGAWVCYHAFPVVHDRLAIWWDPWADADGNGYQIVQSLYALGGGGLFGAGLGQGAAASVPAVHTDLSFVAAAEELGLLGASAILACYALIVVRGLRIAQRARDSVNALLAGGLSLAFGLQTLVILGGVTKLTPLTGVTLPFMSFGGSSLIANCVLVGLLLSISAAEAP